MTNGRATVLGAVRRSLGRSDADSDAAMAAAKARIAAHPRGLLPERSRCDPIAQLDLFQAQVEAVDATVVRLSALAEVPQAVADYLKSHNLPGDLRMAPAAELQALPWTTAAPMLTVTTGKAEPQDVSSLTAAFAGIAETGTLMLHSGPEGPTTLNFLPENHIVVLKSSRVVGAYEEAWERLREARADEGLPRTVNLVTGPSRTGDIEQTIQLGAHGPKRLHILLIEDAG